MVGSAEEPAMKQQKIEEQELNLLAQLVSLKNLC
jgi:hypothetical protein